MTRADAKEEAVKIFDDANAKKDAVYERLKRLGHVLAVLDGPIPPEVKAIENECRRKTKEIAAQIDE